MKKLLLIYPNQRWLKDDFYSISQNHPMTLCLLGSMVKGIVDVKIVDANLNNMGQDEIAQVTKAYQPDFVGISVLTSEYGEILDIAAKVIRQSVPAAVIIAGGVHVTTSFEKVMKNPDIDYCCRGEGEHMLPKLLRYLMGQGNLPEQGLVYRDKNSKIIAQERTLVENLASLPWPDYNLVNFQDYISQQPRIGPNRHPELPGTHIHVTRGCPCRCCFCQVEHISGKKIRWRDPVDVVDELEFLKKTYGLRSFTFEDDNTFYNRSKAKTLLKEMINRQLDLTWRCGALALFALDEEMIDLMAKSGCKTACVSVESGNKRVLRDIVGKPIRNLAKVPELINSLKKSGIMVKASFVIGFPGETWNEIRETICFAENCNADYVVFFNAVALPGTPLYEMCLKNNSFSSDGTDVDVNWRHSKICSKEWTSKDVSILRAYEWDRINFAPVRIDRVAKMWGCSMAELEEIRKKTRDALEF